MKDPFEEEIERNIEHLIEMGFIEKAGYDVESHQETYRVTEKGKQIFPEMYEESVAVFNQACFNLWNKGMIEMAFDLDGMPMVSLNKNSFNEEKILLLPEVERFTLRQLTASITDQINDII